MPWASLRFTPTEVDNAGNVLVDRDASDRERDEALIVVGNWRSCHAFPLNTLQMNLRRIARGVDANVLIAQRIKRLPAIVHKLDRLRHLKLSKFQDIGGCRAILANVKTVRATREGFQRSKMAHALLTEDDYITSPKKSGYRGVHLVYAYRSDTKSDYNGRKIEIQLRSQLQHAWATAVEIVGMFSSQYLKSSRGDARWLRFFALMGSAIALRERAPLVPGTPTTKQDLANELRQLEKSLDARKQLVTFGRALQYIEPQRGDYFLLRLDVTHGRLEIIAFDRRQQATAQSEYLELEKSTIDDPSADVVLVSVDSIKHLKTAYPNYYLDTTRFVQALHKSMAW